MSLKANESAIKLSGEIGNFIEYWGFKKIHGKVWALVFLAGKKQKTF